jgi:hypothetical protein
MENLEDKLENGILIFALILGAIIIYQIIRILLGGSWSIEQAILTLIVINVSISLWIAKIVFKVDKKLHGHIQWHKGKEKN